MATAQTSQDTAKNSTYKEKQQVWIKILGAGFGTQDSHRDELCDYMSFTGLHKVDSRDFAK